MALYEGYTTQTTEGLGYNFSIHWEVNSKDAANNKSNITVSLLGWTTYGNPAYSSDSIVRIYVAGSLKKTQTGYIDFHNHPDRDNALVLATWTGDVSHPTGGTSFDLAVRSELDWRNNQSVSLPYDVYTNSGTVQMQALTQSYKMYISRDPHSYPTVTRNGTTLISGATVNKGDVLRITFTADTGYSLTSHTVNGSTFTSGNTYTVGNSDVTVKCTSAINSYTLSLSEGENSSIIVQRNGETLYNGAPINYGDVLTIYFVANTGYAIGTHTVNGSTFTSGSTHTVTGNVNVVSTASQTSYTLTISKGSNTNLTVKRGSTTLSNGATIYYGDILTITFSANTGYTISQATVNNLNISSGNTFLVVGNTTVKTVATANPYLLTINQGNNTTITVTRGDEELRNGSVIAYGDSLKISFSASPGYAVSVHTVNGSTFTSGQTYTVGNANVTVVSTATTGASLLQPTNIFPDVIYNNGVIDPDWENTISWQVNGWANLVAYEILFYQNDVSSTLIATTGKVVLAEPFYGKDQQGNFVPFEVYFSYGDLRRLGLMPGFEYKMIIRQWWSSDEYVEQLTASVFYARTNPTLQLYNDIIEGYEQFRIEYSQDQGVPINWIRWQVFLHDDHSEPVFDTGILNNTEYFTFIYGDAIPQVYYDYTFTVETMDGYQKSASAINITLPINNEHPFKGNVVPCMQSDGSVLVTWDAQPFTQNYIIRRLNVNNNKDYKQIATVNNNVTSIIDYSASSDTDYIYYVFALVGDNTTNIPGKSGIFHTKFYYWKIIEAHLHERTSLIDTYLIDNVHYFKYGVSEGSFSNNNTPNVLKNFTRYPTWQADSANYLSGSISGYIGSVDITKNYHDSITQSRRIFELSQSEKTLFLLDPEGNFLLIKVANAISMNVRTNNTAMQKQCQFRGLK